MTSKQKKYFFQIISIIIMTLLCFALITISACRFDNKYTYNSLQPINGLLCLTEQDLDANSLYFLTDGWEVYPDKLFTPETFALDSQDAFMQTAAIGHYNDFSFGQSNRGGNGSATYHLTLALPNSERVYSLALPEIFSSYRLYIDGKLEYTMGNPDSAQYSPAIGRHTVTFSGSGTVEILLAVSNYSHYYSGLTYPPLFGEPSIVTRTLNIQLVSRALLTAVIFLIALTALYAWKHTQSSKQITLLYFLTCICLWGYTAYPVITSFFTLKTRFWYALELLCAYGMYLLVVLLQNQIRQVSPKRNLLVSIPVAAFCLFAACYAFFPKNSYILNYIFQTLARFVKFFTAAYLLINAIYAAWHEEEKSLLLLSGTTGFAFSLLADRLFPHYEPIYGGWFPEYGGIFFTLCLGVTILSVLADTYSLQLTLAEEKRQLARQVAMQKLHYQELTEKIEDSIRHRHDERHHLKMICMFLENNELDKLRDYLMDYRLSSSAQERTVLCLNMTADAMLQFYRHQCQEHHIEFSLDADIPADIHISDMAISIILGNLLENAYEACLQVQESGRYIHISARYRSGQLLLRIENSAPKEPRLKNGRFLSSKHSGFGIGSQSVKAAAESYNGQLKYDYTDTSFRVSLILSELTSTEKAAF